MAKHAREGNPFLVNAATRLVSGDVKESSSSVKVTCAKTGADDKGPVSRLSILEEKTLHKKSLLEEKTLDKKQKLSKFKKGSYCKKKTRSVIDSISSSDTIGDLESRFSGMTFGEIIDTALTKGEKAELPVPPSILKKIREKRRKEKVSRNKEISLKRISRSKARKKDPFRELTESDYALGEKKVRMKGTKMRKRDRKRLSKKYAVVTESKDFDFSSLESYENHIIFCYLLFRAESTFDRMAICIAYYNYATGSSFTGDLLGKRVPEVKKYALKLSNALAGIVTESIVDHLSSLRGFMGLIVEGPVGKAVRRFLLCIASFKLFSKDITMHLHKFLGRSEKKPMMDVIADLFDDIIKLTRVGEMLIQGKTVTQALLESDPVGALIKQGEDILLEADEHLRLYDADEALTIVEKEKSLRDYLKSVDDLYVQKLNPFKSDVKRLKEVRNKVSELHTRYVNIAYGGSRPTPYAVVIHGGPGVGKSMVLKFIFKLFAKTMEKNAEQSHDSSMYARTMTSQFWEGYIPSKHWCIRYSEVGSLNKKIAASKGDETVSEFVRVIDSLALMPDMAFGDKGELFAVPELVLADTNTKDMNLKEIANNAAAYKRRFLFVEVKVKEEFTKDDKVSLDPTIPSDRILDKYEFCIEKFSALNAKVNVLESVHRGDIDVLADVLRKNFLDHKAVQDSIMRSEAAIDVDDYGVTSGESRLRLRRLKGLEESDDDAVSVLEEKEDDLELEFNFTEAKDAIRTKVRRVVPYCKETFGELRSNYIAWFSRSVSSIWNFMFWSIVCSVLSVKEITSFFLNVRALAWHLIIFVSVPMYCVSIFGYISVHLVVFLTVVFSLLLYPVEGYAIDWCKAKRGNAWNQVVYNAGFRSFELRTVHLFYVLTGFSLVVAFMRMYKKISHTFQVESDFTDIGEVERLVEAGDGGHKFKTNAFPWFGVRDMSYVPLHTGDCVSLSKSVSANVRACVLHYADGSNSRTCVFGVKKGFALINTHCLKSSKTVIAISNTGVLGFVDKKEVNYAFHEEVLDRSKMVDLGNDLTLISLNRRFRDVSKHIASKVSDRYGQSAICGVDVGLARGVGMIESSRVAWKVDNAIEYSWADHKPGMCGNPLIMNVGGPMIVGIHSAAFPENPKCYSVPIDMEKVDEAIRTLSSGVIMPLTSSSVEPEWDLEDPSDKSLFRFEQVQGLSYFGKLPGAVLVRSKSRLTHFPLDFSEDYKSVGIVSKKKFLPPLMMPKGKGEKYLSPFNIAARKMGKDSRRGLDPTILKKVITLCTVRILTMLKAKGITTVKPIDMDVAINGAIHNPYIRRINTKTSAGFGLKGKKRDYLPVFSDVDGRVTRVPVDELKEKLLKGMRRYDDQMAANYVYGAKLKDEAREREKVLAGKTRTFFASPLDSLVHSRMFLAPIYTLMVEHSDIFCTAVGINPHQDFDALAKEIFAWSEDIFEGDYGGWDVSMPIDISRAASSVIYRVLKGLGYNEAALKQVNGLLSDGLFPLVEMYGDLFAGYGFQPSGKYATAEDNSLKGLILLMYYWYSHPALRNRDFFSCVKVRTYGDDILGSVKNAPEMNIVDYARFCESHFGMTFTTADKKTVTRRYLTPYTSSFLKRNFVYRADFGRYVGPLSVDSILRSLTWMIPSKEISEEEQVVDTVSSALRESFFHLDEKRYTTLRDSVLKKVTAKYGLERAVLKDKCPSFSFLKEDLFG